MNIQSGFIALAIAISTLSAAPAKAALVGVTSIAELGTVDVFDWRQLAPTGTILSGSQNVTSTGGLTGIVSSAGNTFGRQDQGNIWDGNFTSPEALLWSRNVGPDITFSLTNPVSGIGAQIQTNFYGAFIAQITAYNFIGDILGIFSQAGSSNDNNDGSAIFIGFKDTNAEIAKLKFTITQATNSINNFAIGSIYTSGGGVSAVPLPAGLLLFGSAIFGLGAFHRRNSSATA